MRTPEVDLGRLRFILIAALAGWSVATPDSVAGQVAVNVRPIVSIGGEVDERQRLDQLFGAPGTQRLLTRSQSSLLTPDSSGARITFTILAPEVRLVTHSSLPHSANDGPLWAGRGENMMVSGGLALSIGRVRAIVAPQFVSSANREFQVLPFPQDGGTARNVWSNAFHPWPSSIDLPNRFGDSRIARTHSGQSSLAIDLPGATVGVATENEWWGPGDRNAIVLSNSAPGFPHVFARTNSGYRTRFGRFDAAWLVGTLHESDFFDRDTTNDVRSLSSAMVSWTPRSDSGFTLGFSRAVYATMKGGLPPFSAVTAFALPVDGSEASSAIGPPRDGADQVQSVFGRWVVPGANFEVYFEWARFAGPASLRDLLEYPQHSQGYTLGLQWARPVVLAGTDARFRLLAEGTYLEPDPAQRIRPVATTYTSRSVPQGYTNRGQPLGAFIGPGASSQWLTADLFGAHYRLGAFLERIRWDNATVWLPIIPEAKAEDVSLIGGLRGSFEWRGIRLGVDYAHAVRLGFLFQDRVPLPNGLHTGVDLINDTLTLTLALSRFR